MPGSCSAHAARLLPPLRSAIRAAPCPVSMRSSPGAANSGSNGCSAPPAAPAPAQKRCLPGVILHEPSLVKIDAQLVAPSSGASASTRAGPCGPLLQAHRALPVGRPHLVVISGGRAGCPVFPAGCGQASHTARPQHHQRQKYSPAAAQKRQGKPGPGPSFCFFKRFPCRTIQPPFAAPSRPAKGLARTPRR